MTIICLLIHVYFFSPQGGAPREVETYQVETTVDGYWPDVTLFGGMKAWYNPCEDMAEGVLQDLQMGDSSYSALLPGSSETIQYHLECKTFI